MRKIILSFVISSGVFCGMVEAASACMVHTGFPPYCAVKCEINGGSWWDIEKCYIGSKPPINNEQ